MGWRDRGDGAAGTVMVGSEGGKPAEDLAKVSSSGSWSMGTSVVWRDSGQKGEVFLMRLSVRR